MIPTIVKKSYRDLSKKKTRTIFTILTIALGVAGISMFAVIPLMDRAVEEEISETKLFNVQLNVANVDLTQDDINQLGTRDNIESFEPRCFYFTKFYVGERRNDVIFVGVEDLEDQSVDIVFKDSGSNPGYFQVLTEDGNIRNNVFTKGTGDSIRVIDHNGDDVHLEITGKGRCLTYSGYTSQGIAVFYTSIDTVRAIGNLTGYNVLSFRFEDTEGENTEDTIDDIRKYLVDHTTVVAFAEFPEIREEGTWPGQEIMNSIMTIFYSITLVALFCSIFLISNTMNTIVSEQKNEIASMKAIGATRAQVFRSYLTTSGLLGLIGAVFGAIIGILITLAFINFMGGMIGVSPGFMLHIPTILISILVGILVTVLASIPALLGTLRVTIREAMDSHGIAAKFGNNSVDQVLKKTGWLPRTLQLGFRNAGRKKGRSASTIIQVSIAVGVMLGLMGFGYSMDVAVGGEYDNWGQDIRVIGQETGGKPLTQNLTSIIEGIDEVSEVEVYIFSGVQIGDVEFFGFGFHHDTFTIRHERIIEKGRWFTPEDEETRARVFVITESISKRTGVGYGDTIPIMTATGEFEFTVIGISSSLMFNGMSAMFPFETMRDLLKKGDVVSGFAVRTENSKQDEIDRVSTRIEDTMLSEGYAVYNEIWYVMERNNNQMNQMIANVVYAVGSLVVLITLIGLMSTMTMNILERTKEIGMLRCIGAVAKDIRRVFGSEGVLLAIIGWGLGIPIGYLIGRLTWLAFAEVMDVNPPYYYPAINIAIVFLITIVITLIIIQFPLRRATKLRPGDAIRYQ